MQLPPYCHQESSYEIKNYLEDFIQNYHFIRNRLWEPFYKTFPAIDDIMLPADDIMLPAKLEEIKQIPMGSLIDELSRVNTQMEPMIVGSLSKIMSVVFLIILITLIIILVCCRRRIFGYIRTLSYEKKVAKSDKEGLELTLPRSVSKNGKKTGQKPVVMKMMPVRLEDDEAVNRDEQLAASAPSEEGERFTVRHLYPDIVGET
jgi:hypothetical protein